MGKKNGNAERRRYLGMLFHPLWIVCYGGALFGLVRVCQYGAIPRWLLLLGACGITGLCWMVGWTISFFARKKNDVEESGTGRKWLELFLVELVLIAGITGVFGVKLVRTARDGQSVLAWKIREWKNSKKIPLTHDQYYEDEVEGILEDLRSKVDLPKELYITKEFQLDFQADGTITKIETFLYGKGADGEDHSFLVSYDREKSKKMTVWLDNAAGYTYEESMKLQPMVDLLARLDLEKQVQQWNNQSGARNFQLLYYGFRTFSSSQGIVLVAENGTGKEPGELTDSVSGYAVSFHVPYNDTITPKRYLNTWEQAQVNVEQAPEKEMETKPELRTTVTDSTDGTVTYYYEERVGWRLTVTDAAAGSRSYGLEQTTDGGNTWNQVNKDPFGGAIGVAGELEFLDQKLGFLTLGSASGNLSHLYRTANGGKTVKEVKLPMDEVKKKNKKIETAEYDYVYLPEEKKGKLLVYVARDQEDGEKALLFQSSDQGKTWIYEGLKDRS